MAKSETAERHPRIDHERAVVLALADPGHLDENGKLQKPTHKQIAERLYEKPLSRLQGRSKAIKLSSEAQSVRDIGRGFIGKLNNRGYLNYPDLARTTALFEEIEGMYSKRSLEPDDLYEIFGISQSENNNPFGSHYLNITAPRLPQPETDPKLREVKIGDFVDRLMEIRQEGPETHIGDKLPTHSRASGTPSNDRN